MIVLLLVVIVLEPNVSEQRRLFRDCYKQVEHFASFFPNSNYWIITTT